MSLNVFDAMGLFRISVADMRKLESERLPLLRRSCLNSSLEVFDFLTLLYIWLGARRELVGVTGALGDVAGEAPKEVRTAESPFESFRPRTFLFDLKWQIAINSNLSIADICKSIW